jgi:hypothetical protein
LALVPAIALALALALPPASPVAADTGALRLTEILAGPARDWDQSGAFSSRDDEWVELKNTGPTPLDLSPFFITDGDSIPRCGLSGTLAAGGRRVIFGGDAYAWERENGHPAFGLSLGNTGDTVILWEVAAGETLQVDAYAYRSHEAAADRSIARILDDGAWELFDGLNPYTGSTPPAGNLCGPTPGDLNQCVVTPARAVTWGGLKARYR